MKSKFSTYKAIVRNDCSCCPCCGECHCEEDGVYYYESKDFGNNESGAINWVAKEIKSNNNLIGEVEKIGPRGGNLGRMTIRTGKERNNYYK